MYHRPVSPEKAKNKTINPCLGYPSRDFKTKENNYEFRKNKNGHRGIFNHEVKS
jgi:hypothetical protein